MPMSLNSRELSSREVLDFCKMQNLRGEERGERQGTLIHQEKCRVIFDISVYSTVFETEIFVEWNRDSL